MRERAAQIVSLVRAFEAADAQGLILRPGDRTSASEAAQTALPRNR